MAEQLVASGSFTSDGTIHNIALRSDFDSFNVLNRTQSATTQGTGRGVEFSWRRGLADGEAFMWTKQNASNAIDLEFITTAGFTRVDQSVQTLGAAVTLATTFVTAANPAVVTANAHGYSNNDRVRIFSTTTMLNIAGYDFTIGSVATNTFELSFMDTSDGAIFTQATAGTVRRVPNNPIFSPENNRITAMTAADPMVVTLAVIHGMSIGEKVRVKVSSDYGMVEADNLIGEITAVSTANNTISLNIDSTAFTAFAFPTSAVAALGVTPAHIVPVGEIPTVFSGSITNTAEILMQLGAGADGPAGSNNDVIYWEAIAAGFRLVE